MEAATKGHFRLAGREFPRVTWYTDPSLRKTCEILPLHPFSGPFLIQNLDICLMMVILTSATNGYDGSMVNGLQSLPAWKECK